MSVYVHFLYSVNTSFYRRTVWSTTVVIRTSRLSIVVSFTSILKIRRRKKENKYVYYSVQREVEKIVIKKYL